MALQKANMVICRSGYSTLMDLVKLQKKAILIPTPGQTEQEYLAKQLNEQGAYPFFEQQHFAIDTALKKAAKFPYHILQHNSGMYNVYKKVLDDWLD